MPDIRDFATEMQGEAEREMGAIGRQLMLELWGCDPRELSAPTAVKRAIEEAVSACGATLVELMAYRFSDVGVTGLAVLTESHLIVHTWPEYGYAAADIFTCGERADPTRAVEVLQRHFRAERVQVSQMERGVLAGEAPKPHCPANEAAQ